LWYTVFVMARKKKEKKESFVEEEVGEEKTPFLHGDAKRSIVAVFLFAFAALFVLGFFESAGPLGEFLNKALGKTLGWGKWVFPPVLVVAGVFLLQRRQSSFAEALKLTGLAVAFFSLLGFFHLYLDGDVKEVASQGEGGGYVGLALSLVLVKMTGMIAATIILATLLLTGLIVAFNWSLVHFFERLRERLRRSGAAKEPEKQEEEEDDEEEEVEEMEEREEENAMNEEESRLAHEAFGEEASRQKMDAVTAVEEGGESHELHSQNIRSIEFVDDEKVGARAAQADEDDEDEEDQEGEEEPLPKPRVPKKKPKPLPWQLPSLDLLEASSGKAHSGNVEERAAIIQRTFKHFGIDMEPGEVQTGPTVTQFTFRPAVGVKLSRITALSNDLALALAAHPIRIEAPIPGKSLVGIEVPNRSTATVKLKDVLAHQTFARKDSPLSLVLGQDVSGQYVIGDLRKMPHVLVAGATNSGKSVCINAMLLSLLYQNSPEDLKLILVDPKRVELSLYNGIPHLLTDVVVENKKVVSALKWAVSEMERRYKLLQATGSRDLLSYQQKFKQGETYFTKDPETGKEVEEDLEKLPYVVIVIDEMADLMMAHAKEVESSIVRLAQMARAVGIHLILATQRPSVEVLTGLIKANVTTRIAFQVATQIDSRTILDQGGAEKLLGRGDMLYVAPGSSQPKRLQGVFISESEVKKVVDFLHKQTRSTEYEEPLGDDLTGGNSKEAVSVLAGASSGPLRLDLDGVGGGGEAEDDLYLEAKQTVIQAGKASASLLQRRLRVGYARAARLLDLLEEDGVIGPGDGAKPREVYASGNGSEGASEEDPMAEQERRDRWQV
jgi:DNA segregation ATPase FtsK/SpoIIIE-like protein